MFSDKHLSVNCELTLDITEAKRGTEQIEIKFVSCCFNINNKDHCFTHHCYYGRIVYFFRLP